MYAKEIATSYSVLLTSPFLSYTLIVLIEMDPHILLLKNVRMTKLFGEVI